ncbi:MAG: RraA family protein [Alphaproteobacteria bacterium]|nr:RraA family protein [Alphaproteobacteria bacterium]
MRADDELLDRARLRLFTAVLSDTLDALGRRDQAFRPGIRPLDESLVLFGRARTGLYAEVYSVAPGENPYALEIALIDDLAPGEIPVLACQGSPRIAPWGELLTTAAMARGAAGCVTDGLVRDIRQIRELRFPVFHGGIGPLDSKGRGKVIAIDVPVTCGGVHVRPGELVMGDADGVVVVPADIERDCLLLALEKVEGEDRTREELLAGARLADVFARHGIL